MKRVLSCFVLLWIVACKQASNSPEVRTDFKDSIVKAYLASIDSMEFYDTLNQDFRILKAYIKNDTSFFAGLKEDILRTQQEASFMSPIDSCVKQKRLSNSEVDQAYRFKHWEAFCFFSQNITITRTGDKVDLHYIEYSNGTPDGQNFFLIKTQGDTLKIGPHCTVIKEFDKKLSMKDWKELEEKVRDADYWGMKNKGGGGLDGSVWEIDAYANDKSGYSGGHSVWRHNNNSTCFEELGRFMLQLSGEKTMCESIN